MEILELIQASAWSPPMVESGTTKDLARWELPDPYVPPKGVEAVSWDQWASDSELTAFGAAGSALTICLLQRLVRRQHRR